MKRAEAKKMAKKLFYIHDMNAGNGINLSGDAKPYKVMYQHSPGITRGNHRILAECGTKEKAKEKLDYLREGFLRSIGPFIQP